jgi:hypothetical protein
MSKIPHGAASSDEARRVILDELRKHPAGRETDLSTVCFVREKAVRLRRAHFVTLKAADDDLCGSGHRDYQMHLAFFLIADGEDGWRITSYGAHRPPRKPIPRAYLGGGDDVDGFFAAGYVDGAGAEIERVELRFADGMLLEDRPEHEIVLFVVDSPVVMPPTVALIGSEGEEIVTHPVLPG